MTLCSLPDRSIAAIKPYDYNTSAEFMQAIQYCDIGMLFCKGERYPKNFELARSWFKEAADLKLPEANFLIGQTFYWEEAQNSGSVKDAEQESFKWYMISAEQGFPKAQFVLAHCYQYGIGVQQDQSKAFEWHNKSAEQGCEEAKSKLRNIDLVVSNVFQDRKNNLTDIEKMKFFNKERPLTDSDDEIIHYGKFD